MYTFLVNLEDIRGIGIKTMIRGIWM